MEQQKNHKGLWGTFLVFIITAICVAAALFYSSPSEAKPSIKWSPKSITQEIDAGHSKTVTASFTASKDLTDVVVRVVPELEPYVATNPIAFGDVAKGETRELKITISAPVEADSGTIDGTIQLRRGSGSKKTYAKPLPVTINLTGLPPDPGEAGKATLEGIDSDEDGVRDDIQRYIALTYPDSEKTRAALTQLAIAMQATLVDSQDANASRKHRDERAAAGYCLYYLYDHPREAIPLQDDLRAMFLNTEIRGEAYIQSDSYLDGVYKIAPQKSWKSFCEFNPDTMEN